MEPKSKKKIWIIILVAFVLIVATVIIILVVNSHNNSNKNSGNSNTDATNTSITIENITNSYNDAIVKKEISQEYNGTYQLVGVAYAAFDFGSLDWDSAQQEQYKQKFYSRHGFQDFNGLIRYLQDAKNAELNGQTETITFNNGRYIKELGEVIVENGIFYGDANLSIVSLKNNNFFVSLNYKVPSQAMSTVTSSNQQSDMTKLYVFKEYSSNKDQTTKSRVTLRVAYEYKLIPKVDQILESDLDIFI